MLELGKRSVEPYYAFKPLPASVSQQLFLKSTKRVRALCGGNASGKTSAGAYAVADMLIRQQPPRDKCPFWVISKSYEMVGGISWGEKLSQYIHPRNIYWITWTNKARGWPAAIGLHNGWVIEFKSWEQGRQAFQARSIGGAWLDEQFPEDVFHEVFVRTRDFSGPIFFTLTPIDPDAFLEERYHDVPDDWEWFELHTEDNRKTRGGYLDDAWVDAFIADTPPDFRDVRLLGKFSGFAGAVYKMFRREVHVCDPYPDNVPPDGGRIVRGIDFGFNNPFVCLWARLDGDGCWTVFDEHYQPRELIGNHAKAINGRPTYRQGIGASWADPEDAQSRAELAKLDIPTGAAKKDVMSGIEEVQKALMVQSNGKPRLRITANCRNLIREMATYRWESNGSTRRDAKDEPEKKNDHCVDSLRYILFSEKQNQWITPSRIVGSDSLSRGFSALMPSSSHEDD